MSAASQQSPEPLAPVSYEADAYAWSIEQAALLRAGRWSELDVEHLAEEVLDVGNAQYDKLESALTRALQHFLKWDCQPERRSRSWALTIAEHRRRIGRVLSKNPSLHARLREAVAEAFESAIGDALIETDLPRKAFPAANPYAWDEIMTRPVLWPEDEAS